MCVLCAYIGTEPAAPIMLDMLEREEGFWGGYYTGLATVSDSTLRYDKVVGDVAALREQSDAESLPGTIGIAHSRTPSGGDREWGHPFIDCKERLAYVAQGSMGAFKDVTDMDNALAALIKDGHAIRSLCNEQVSGYPSLPDGRSAHLSDMMCHAIEARLEEHGDPITAIRESFEWLRAEVVNISLAADRPDRIFAATLNQSLCVGRDNEGTYLASTNLAFPDSAKWHTRVPANSIAVATRDSLEIHPLLSPAETPVDAASRAAVEDSVLTQLHEEQGKTLPQLYKGMSDLWPQGLAVKAPVLYEVVERLVSLGKIRYETTRVPGMFDKGTAPQCRFCLQ